jgi:SAM-dependent methyltransferase
LHATVAARETWGLDASAAYVARAQDRLGLRGSSGGTPGRAPPSLSFVVHDVTRAPYPVADVDLAYARYLVNHLSDTPAFFDACARAMRPGGTLVLEENCSVSADDQAFGRYYVHVERMQRHYGQDMFVGERLPAIAGEAFHVLRFERTGVTVDARAMARIHAMNVRTWRSDPFAATTFDAEEVDAITAALDAIAAGERAASPVTWVMGQIVLERR